MIIMNDRLNNNNYGNMKDINTATCTLNIVMYVQPILANGPTGENSTDIAFKGAFIM